MRSSLKTTLTWIMVGVAAVGLLAVAALVIVTSLLHVTSRDLSRAVESVRVTDAIERQLLIHHETRSPPIEGAIRAALLHSVDEASGLVDSAEEQQRVEELGRAMKYYLGPSSGNAELAAVAEAAHRLSLLNLEQARQKRQRAAAWDRIANIGGVATAVVLLLVTLGFLLWVGRPFRFAASMSAAMRRFAEGDLEARAPEGGALELGVIARTFNVTAEALVRARDRQAEYVATAVHDLRTPLAAIQLAVGYVAPDRPLPSESRLRELFVLIGRQLKRMNGLIGDVLNAAWIEQGELTLLAEDTDLRVIAAEAVKFFRTLAPEHLFELSLPAQPQPVLADRMRLDQVFGNLLANAVKQSPIGSRIRVELAREGHDIVVTVRDEGPGLTPEEREHLFDPYRPSSPSDGPAGSHLGLWVSRRVIDAHHGRMEVESQAGRGSTFRIVLPMRTNTAGAEARS